MPDTRTSFSLRVFDAVRGEESRIGRSDSGSVVVIMSQLAAGAYSSALMATQDTGLQDDALQINRVLNLIEQTDDGDDMDDWS